MESNVIAFSDVIYLSGPMTGRPGFNFAAFHTAEADLRDMGYDHIVNPATLNPDTSLPWFQCMRNDIKALCDCTALVLLEGFEHSKGAQLELHVAHRLGLKVMQLRDLKDLHYGEEHF